MSKYKYDVGGAYTDANNYLAELRGLLSDTQLQKKSDYLGINEQVNKRSENITLENSLGDTNSQMNINYILSEGYNNSLYNQTNVGASEKIVYRTGLKDDVITNIGIYGNILFKDGVTANGLKKEIYNAASVFSNYGDTVITSGLRLILKTGAKEKSLHLKGQAIDIRLSKQLRDNLNEIRKQLKDYDVIDEGDHIHVEYQLKKKKAQYGLGNLYDLLNYSKKTNLRNNSNLYLNMLLSSGALKNYSNLISGILTSSQNSISNFNTELNGNATVAENNMKYSNLSNSAYGMLDMLSLGAGQIAQFADSTISAQFNAMSNFTKTGDGLGAVTDLLGNVLIVGSALKSITGVRDSVRAKRQESVANRLQEFGTIGTLNQVLGQQEEDKFERQQMINSYKRLKFQNFHNSGIDNNLMYFRYGGKYKFEDGGLAKKKIDAKDALGRTYSKNENGTFNLNGSNQQFTYNTNSRKFILYDDETFGKLMDFRYDNKKVFGKDNLDISYLDNDALSFLINKYGNLNLVQQKHKDKRNLYENIEGLLTGNKPHYNLFNKSINVKDDYDILGELLHAYQDKKGYFSLLRILKELITTEDLYITDGTLESDAHNIIEQKIRKEYYNLTMKKKDFKEKYSIKK